MKEKVIIVSGESHLTQPEVDSVNLLLEQGWTVKSITPASHNHWATAIFVLQKECEE